MLFSLRKMVKQNRLNAQRDSDLRKVIFQAINNQPRNLAIRLLPPYPFTRFSGDSQLAVQLPQPARLAIVGFAELGIQPWVPLAP